MRSAAHLELVRESITTAATLAHERTLPVRADLAAVVPSGALQRGSSVAVHGVGATSFGLAVVGQAIRDGAFLAIVAPESFSLATCLDFDVPLRRVVQFVFPGKTPPQQWAQSIAAIVEGFDIVMLADRRRIGSSHARQLTARTRERGSVLVRIKGPAWPDGADVRFDVSSPEWSGLGQGHGHLQMRQVSVQVAGRRVHSQGKKHDLLLPALHGGVALSPDADVAGGVGPVTPMFPAASVAPVAPAVQESETGQAGGDSERFAGADIDVMLDAVDARADEQGEDQASDLNATA